MKSTELGVYSELAYINKITLEGDKLHSAFALEVIRASCLLRRNITGFVSCLKQRGAKLTARVLPRSCITQDPGPWWNEWAVSKSWNSSSFCFRFLETMKNSGQVFHGTECFQSRSWCQCRFQSFLNLITTAIKGRGICIGHPVFCPWYQLK